MRVAMAVAFGLGGVMAFALSRARARRAARGQVFSRRGASWSTAPARIVCFGDSITEYGSAPDGWVARLGWAYSRKADVVNRGLSGYTSRLVRAILAELLAPLGPLPCERTAAVTLMLGSNDATEPGGFQHVPPDEFLAHMVAILRALRAAFPAATLLVLSPPPVDGAAWDAHCRRAYGAGGDGRSLELAREYGALAHRAAVATGCLFVDVLSSMIGPRADAHFAHLLSDGLHLSAAGHAHVYNLTQLALRDTAAAPDALREHFPRDPVGAPQLLLPCRR